jgi:hypothetical protein
MANSLAAASFLTADAATAKEIEDVWKAVLLLLLLLLLG